MRLKEIKQLIIEYLIILIGDIILGISVSIFLVPNNLSTGGFSGLATILNTFINMKVGTWIIVLNSLLILVSGYLFGLRFVLRTTISIFLFGFFTNFFSRFNPITNDLILASLCGGVLTGIGISLNIRARSTTGGSELLAKISNHYFKKVNLSEMIFVIDAIIIGLFILVFKNIDYGLYSVIAIFISTKVIDIIIEGVNYATLVNIISDKNDQIGEAIMQKMGRGVTMIEAQGFYTKSKKKMIHCVVGRRQIQEVKSLAKQIDENAFVIISNAKEVLGKGFSIN